jgi:hypothetical protein
VQISLFFFWQEGKEDTINHTLTMNTTLADQATDNKNSTLCNLEKLGEACVNQEGTTTHPTQK